MRVLVTRPQPAAERTAAKLRARGCEVLLAPLLRVELLAPDLGIGPWSGLVLSSANAVAAAERHPRLTDLVRLPVFTVGARTAEAARRAGFRNVRSADGAGRDLAALVLSAAGRGGGPILYLAGEDRAGDLAGDLADAGLETVTAAAYRAAKATSFPADAKAALAAGLIDGVLHYSRRSAEAYLDCAAAACQVAAALAPVHFCLSQQVAEPLFAAGAGKVLIAERSEEASLFNLLVSK